MATQFVLKKQPAFFDNPRRGCANTDVQFFAPDQDRYNGFDSAPAKRVCRHCPFVSECLTYALKENIEDGIWGGMDERQRKAIRRCLQRKCHSRCSHEWRRKIK